MPGAMKRRTLTMHDLSNHEHQHFHEHVTAYENKIQAVTILEYLLEHNRAHADELHEICHKLEASGESEAAFLVDDAVGCFRDGTARLELALENLKKEK